MTIDSNLIAISIFLTTYLISILLYIPQYCLILKILKMFIHIFTTFGLTKKKNINFILA